MSIVQQPDPPVYKNTSVPNVTFYRGAWYVDMDARMLKGAHTHICEDVGLVRHFRCKLCGLCQEKR